MFYFSDPYNDEIKMPYDGYLKLWQLKQPILKNIPDCRHDVLMIDEGQDMNPAMLEIFNYQKTTKIIVGKSFVIIINLQLKLLL